MLKISEGDLVDPKVKDLWVTL